MEGTRKSIWDDLKHIDLVGYLDSLGYQPQKIRNHDYWYLSPLRNEKTPSFKVNRHQNVWFDHGIHEGGSIIDFGVKFFKCTAHEFVEKLTQIAPANLPNYRNNISDNSHQTSNRIEILTVSDLSSHALISYLQKRAIDPELAKRHCDEVKFRIGNGTYVAIGFPNRSGAYELRNHWFKGSSSPKDISIIDNGKERLSILEGFMDFLSLLQIETPELKRLTDQSNFLILNSVSLLTRSLPILQSGKDIQLFLDNDPAAERAKDMLIQQGISFHDASQFYNGYKDINDYIKSRTPTGQQVHRKPRNRLRR